MQLDHITGIYNYSINLHKNILKNMLCFKNAIGKQKLLCTWLMVTFIQRQHTEKAEILILEKETYLHAERSFSC